MKVIKKSKMPNGVKIQIEDWTKDYSCYDTVSIAAYPPARNTGKWRWVRGGETFRLHLSRCFDNDEQVYSIFERLEKGEIKLEELHKHYGNCGRDKYYMGLIDCFSPEYNPEW